MADPRPFDDGMGTGAATTASPRSEPNTGPGVPESSTETHANTLLRRAQAGEASAISSLFARHALPLRRWAHGRLPVWLRRVVDTGDLVQDAIYQTIRHLSRFEPRGRGALAAYLRQTVINRIRDEHRRMQRWGMPEDVPDTLVDPGPSPFDQASLAETRERYLSALAKLRPADQELIVAHIELGYSHEQLGCMRGRTANAARVALKRALERLAREMVHA